MTGAQRGPPYSQLSAMLDRGDKEMKSSSIVIIQTQDESLARMERQKVQLDGSDQNLDNFATNCLLGVREEGNNEDESLDSG